MSSHQSRPTAAEFDAEAAADYDRRSRVGIPGYDALHDVAVAMLGDALGDDARLLVVGAGTGEELLRLGQTHPRWRFAAVDPSPHMLAVAKRRIAEAGLVDRVELVEGTTDLLPAQPTHDAATLILVLHFLPDDGAKLALLRDIAERLRPGAPLVLVDLFGDARSEPFARLFGAWQRQMLDRGIPPDDVATRFQELRQRIAFVPEARLADLLREAGFGEPLPFWRALLFGGWLAHRDRPAS